MHGKEVCSRGLKKGYRKVGPISPLLGNIYLNQLDWELERRGHKFVRYADDVLILCKSPRAAERTMESITRFIEGDLRLKVNHEKSKVVHLKVCEIPRIRILFQEGRMQVEDSRSLHCEVQAQASQ